MKDVYQENPQDSPNKKWFGVGQQHGYVAYKDNKIIIAFPGADDDINLQRWGNPSESIDHCGGKYNCRVVSAFYDHYKPLKQRIFNKVDAFLTAHSIEKRNAAIVITGYSLGGAMASYCALDMIKDGYKAPNLITFGSPKAGNQAVQEFMNWVLRDRMNFRITFKRDKVPSQPSFSKHAGTEIRFTSLNTYTVYPEDRDNSSPWRNNNQRQHKLERYSSLE